MGKAVDVRENVEENQVRLAVVASAIRDFSDDEGAATPSCHRPSSHHLPPGHGR